MNKMSILIVALMACAAIAQPFVNVPPLPLYNYVERNSGTASYPTVGAVVAAGWAFTADGSGVYAMNKSAPMNTVPTWYDSLSGVTNMYALGPWNNMSMSCLIVIAGPMIVQYRFNETNIWRSNWFMAKNATFNLRTDGTSSAPNNLQPVFVANPSGMGWLMVLGTSNTSNYATSVALPSTVYAFNPWDLSIEWQTVMNSDTTNFQMANCDTFIWILTQNRTFGYSNVKLTRLFINNGTRDTWWYNTQDSSSVAYVSVQYSRFMIFSSNGYATIGALNGTILNKDSFSGCSTMPFVPLVANSTWVFTCNTRFYRYSNESSQLIAAFSADSTIYCGSMNQMTNDIVFVGGQYVYVWNASGTTTLFELGTPLQSSYNGVCTGATFNYEFGHEQLPSMVMNLVHLSFSSYYSGDPGEVLVVDYKNGNIVAQLSAEVRAFGPVVVDHFLGKAFVASSRNPVLLSYDFSRMHNTNMSIGYVTKIASTYPTRFSLAYNGTNYSAYYISQNGDGIFSVDYLGNQALVASPDIDYVYVQPIIVGQYLVMLDSGYNELWVYDSVAKTTKSVSICDPSIRLMPLVYKTKVIVFCSYAGASWGDSVAQLVDISMSTLTVVKPFTPKSATSYTPELGGVIVGTTFIVATVTNEIRGFDLSVAAATNLWTIATLQVSTIQSNFVAWNGLAYFIAVPVATIGTTTVDITPYIFSVSPGLGLTAKLQRLSTNNDVYIKSLFIKTGGVFGGGLAYVIGSQNVTAYTVSWSPVFTYKHNSTITTMQQGNPTILDNSGAVCFYDNSGNFNVVGGFKGGLAWQYPATTGIYYPVLTDNVSVYFTDGTVVVGADIYSGAVSSISTFQYGTTRGFGLTALSFWNASVVVGVTSDQVVFANLVGQYVNTNPYFPGSGSAPSNNGSGGDSGSSSSKAWIAGVVIGVIVVLAVVVFVAKKNGDGGRSDDNYVPMNPATQV